MAIDAINQQTAAHASATVSLSSLKLTPGQQLSLTISITYPEGVEIFFDVNQVDWQEFTLLTHQKNSPTWPENQGDKTGDNAQWKVDYIIDLIVPLAGEYQLPEMILHSYLHQQHQSQIIQTPNILVTSSFLSSIANKKTLKKLQPIEEVTQLADEHNSGSSLLIFAIILGIFSIIFLLFKQKQSTNKDCDNTAENKTVISPVQLLLKVKEKDEYHWHELRQCMLAHLGFDPLDEHINIQYLALRNRYISARFTAGNEDENKTTFIELCQRCLSNSKLTDDGINSGDKHA